MMEPMGANVFCVCVLRLAWGPILAVECDAAVDGADALGTQRGKLQKVGGAR